MLKHPEELGFKFALKIRIGQPADITDDKPDALTRDVVYVALFADDGAPLEKGDVLKVGQTKGSLIRRWKSIAGTFARDNLRPNEMGDRRKWLRAADGREVSVWMKPAETIEIPYTKGLTRTRFSIRCAEEEFLDQYYEPKIGMVLNRENKNAE